MNIIRWLFFGAITMAIVMVNSYTIQAQRDTVLLTTTASYTPPRTVTGWPSRTPSLTPSATLPGTNTATPTPTSHPGEPTLMVPPDGALLSQPVMPNKWY